MISIVSKSRQIQVFNLTRELAPRRMVLQRRVDGDDGGFSRRDHRVVVPDSITVLAGGRVDGLHSRVVHAPEIAAALAKKLIAIEETPRVKDEETSAPSIDSSAPVPAAPKSRVSR